MTKFCKAAAQGTGLKADAHHATVSIIHRSATKDVMTTEMLALRHFHIASTSSGGNTYNRLDSAAVASAPTIVSMDQRGGLNCRATNKQAIPIAQDKKKALIEWIEILCM